MGTESTFVPDAVQTLSPQPAIVRFEEPVIEEEEEQPQLNLWVSVGLLVVVTVVCVFFTLVPFVILITLHSWSP